MKCLLVAAVIYFPIAAMSQTPGLTIHFKMDSIKSGSHLYKIEMKDCEPARKTERGDWFSHDTSKINFSALKAGQIQCGDYFGSNTPTLISGTPEERPSGQFEYEANQFAWEKIFVFRITDQSSRLATLPSMYVVMPMKYKSFVTVITLTGLVFQPGQVIFLKDYRRSQEGLFLRINQPLDNCKGVEVKAFPQKAILE